MTVVVDSNILITYGLTDEPLHTHTNQMLSSWRTMGTPLTAPRLFHSELTAVVRKVVYQQRITHLEGREMLAKLLAYPVEVHEDDALLKAAYELAHQFNRPRAYDSQYLALAERSSCDFWTADERLFNALKDQFSGIHWLGNWKL